MARRSSWVALTYGSRSVATAIGVNGLVGQEQERHRGHSRTHLAQRQAAAGRLATFNAFIVG